MKYVHSLWSAPSTEKNFDNKYDVKYLTKNFYSYLLSALLVKKMGHEIELFCDENAYNMYSEIPYDKIHIIDFANDGVSSKFWIWSKIKTHLLMNEPYVHIDGDVFLFNDIIGDNLTNGNYCVAVQSVENGKTISGYFQNLYVNSANPFLKLNNGINWDKYEYSAYNCGVAGFSDMELKNEYANKVKEILVDISNDNDFKTNRLKYEGMFLIAEQTLLYYLLREKNIQPFEIIPYSEIEKNNFDFNYWYTILPRQIGYCHLLGYSKYKKEIINRIKSMIAFKFSEYKSIIENFERKYYIE